MDFKLNLFISPDTIKVKVTETFFLYINWDKLQYLMTDSFISIILATFFRNIFFCFFYGLSFFFKKHNYFKNSSYIQHRSLPNNYNSHRFFAWNKYLTRLKSVVSTNFKKIVEKVEYNMAILRQSACLVVN